MPTEKIWLDLGTAPNHPNSVLETDSKTVWIVRPEDWTSRRICILGWKQEEGSRMVKALYLTLKIF